MKLMIGETFGQQEKPPRSILADKIDDLAATAFDPYLRDALTLTSDLDIHASVKL